jgi:hypothetical protein
MAADTTDTTRIVALSRSRKKSFIFKYAGVRACLISVPLSRLALKQSSWSESGCPPSHKNSNNPLAVEPEAENDAARESCSANLAG